MPRGLLVQLLVGLRVLRKKTNVTTVVLAPLGPGLKLRYSFSQRLVYGLVKQRCEEILEVDIDEASGAFRDFHLDVQYRWKPNVALGLGYSLLGLKAEVSDADLPGRLDIEASGPEAFFRVSF